MSAPRRRRRRDQGELHSAPQDRRGSFRGHYPSVMGLSTRPTAPKFTFGGRPPHAVGQELTTPSPGPGHYLEGLAADRSARHTSQPHFSFSAAERNGESARKQRQPGPGTYEISYMIGEGTPSFTCTPRRGPSTVDKNPGPGDHDLPDLIGKVSPKHSITPRREYSPSVSRTAPAPGPGEYDASAEGRADSKSVSMSASPRWGFGSSLQRPRGPGEASDATPGPGTYRHPSELRGPKFSMRMKTQSPKLCLARFD